MNKPSKTNIRTFVRFNSRTFKCGKYTFIPALLVIGRLSLANYSTKVIELV